MKKLFILFLIFFMLPASAEILNDFSNICGVSGYHRMYAKPKSFTCLPEQFLPANTYECVSCPSGYTCSGGTYTFNSTNAQGLVLNGYISNNTNNTCAKNTGHIINGRYVRNVHNCSPGYYLPANTDGCTICPLNNICIGGTYTFNETTTQGIEQCPNNTPFAPAGSSVCYPHILHVGNDVVYLSSTKKTTPSLNVAYGNEVFYANMTITQTTMSANSEHYLKTIYNNEIYYVCDDTACPQ